MTEVVRALEESQAVEHRVEAAAEELTKMARYSNGDNNERQCGLCETYVHNEDMLVSLRSSPSGRLQDGQGLCPKCGAPMLLYIRHDNGEEYWVPVTLSQEYIEDHRNVG